MGTRASSSWGIAPGDNAPLSIIELVEADDVPASADQPEEAAAAE